MIYSIKKQHNIAHIATYLFYLTYMEIDYILILVYGCIKL